jgi:hypothetical protein
MKSVMNHSFSDAPQIDAPRSVFDRSHGHKTTFDAGKLVPFYWDEVYPGDTFKCNVSILARLNTPLFPIMDNMYLDTHFFFVPYRLIWDNARKFFGEQHDPGDSIDYSVPTKISNATTGVSAGTLEDYLGIPPGIPSLVHSALPRRAYRLIWSEWFRDQNLQDGDDESSADESSGPTTGLALYNRGKRHDYFTSCLPWPQKGDAVDLPLGTSAEVKGIFGNSTATTITGSDWRETGGTLPQGITEGWSGSNVAIKEAGTTDYPNVYADLTNATAATINELREAFQVQKLLERDARAGTRYSEIIKNHFGVDFHDVTYRPEFLGGGSQPVNISQVAQTSNDGTNGAVGDLAAYGISSGSNHSFTKSFVEHGIVMGICSVRADLTYQQGIERQFLRSTRYDFYWPSLAHLGEQAVTNIEIYAQGDANDDLVFGYQERYAELRYKPSKITGQLRSSHATSLDSWHLSQEFSSLPTLGNTFIQENPPLDRCIAVPSEPHFVMDSYMNLICARPMPVFGVPGMIDHF